MTQPSPTQDRQVDGAAHRRDAVRGSRTLSEQTRPGSLRHGLDPASRAAWPGARVAGPAFTVQGAGGDNLALQHAVLAAPGRVACSSPTLSGAAWGHWGEVLAVAAQERGIAGLVIDGGCPRRRRDGDTRVSRSSPGTPRSAAPANCSAAPSASPSRSAASVAPATYVGDADGVSSRRSRRRGAQQRRPARRRANIGSSRRCEAGETTLDIYGLGEASGRNVGNADAIRQPHLPDRRPRRGAARQRCRRHHLRGRRTRGRHRRAHRRRRSRRRTHRRDTPLRHRGRASRLRALIAAKASDTTASTSTPTTCR